MMKLKKNMSLKKNRKKTQVNPDKSPKLALIFQIHKK